jgi:hypothetical protein
VKTRRSTAFAFLLLAFAGMAWVFLQVIWNPLYRGGDASGPSDRSDASALQLEVERQDGGGTKSWSIADQQAISRLRAGLQSAEGAAQSPPPPPSEQKYHLRIRRPDSRVDEYDVILGPEGPAHDQVYVIRRSGGGPVYGTAYNTPELRSALQQVLVPPAPK